ncbi:MAG TPA: hypothetical protein PK490_12300 [Prosthecobacter sp.]|nr:hypothetical protein [Prosthecobacter sp.]
MRQGCSTFIPRSCHEPGGFGYEWALARGEQPLELPAAAAGYRHYQDGSREWVTWEQLHAARTARQAERLAAKLWPAWHVYERRLRPAQVWVFDNEGGADGVLHAGTYCYLRWQQDGLACTPAMERRRGIRAQGSHAALALHLMRVIPLEDLLLLPENFEDWKEAFMKAYPKVRTRNDPRRAGVLSGWSDGVWWERRRGDFRERLGADFPEHNERRLP